MHKHNGKDIFPEPIIGEYYERSGDINAAQLDAALTAYMTRRGMPQWSAQESLDSMFKPKRRRGRPRKEQQLDREEAAAEFDPYE